MEVELREEGWLFEDENLLEVLEKIQNLNRRHLSEIELDINIEEGPFDESWTEEDYKYFYKEI